MTSSDTLAVVILILLVLIILAVACGFMRVRLDSRWSLCEHCLVLYTERRIAARNDCQYLTSGSRECWEYLCHCALATAVVCYCVHFGISSPVVVEVLEDQSQRVRVSSLARVLKNCLESGNATTAKAVLSLPLEETALRDFAGLAEDERDVTNSWLPVSVLVFKQKYDAAATVLSIPDHKRNDHIPYLVSYRSESHGMIPTIISAGYGLPDTAEAPFSMLTRR